MAMIRTLLLLGAATAIAAFLYLQSSSDAAARSSPGTDGAGAISNSTGARQPVGPGNIVVHPKFGGQLLGFGIDAHGNEGLLSEFATLTNGTLVLATETFDQKTGKILKVVAKDEKNDDYSTWGVFGHHVGLDEFYDQGQNSFPILNPLSDNAFTGTWTPTIPQGDGLRAIAGSLENSDVAVMMIEIGGNQLTYVFGSNLSANTFGPTITLTDPIFGNVPVIALDSKTHQAVLAASYGRTPELALADLKTGNVSEFQGVGWSYVNGIAVDPTTGIAVTTTTGDALIQAGVQFYDLAKQAGIQTILPCSNNGGEEESGTYVAFDPINSLFLVAQPYNACNNGSNIYVYDEKGNVVETLSNFQTFPASPTLIALHPGNRSGFVFGNQYGTALQSFTY
jgi:hypothetical protein